MNIRCPQCEYTRTISPTAIPPSAEKATCPKCGHRFRFRSLSPDFDDDPPAPGPRVPTTPETSKPSMGLAPQEALDVLNQQWERQLKQQVTEVVTPRPGPRATPQTLPLREEQEHASSAPQDTAIPDSQKLPPPPSISKEAPLPPERTLPPASPSQATLPIKDAAHTPPPSGIVVLNDGTPVEERVERDLLLLRQDQDRPLRDLGRLDPEGFSDPQETEEKLQGGIPWEESTSRAWGITFFRTLHDAMFTPQLFFSRLRPTGSLAPGYLFFLLLGTIAILSSLAWTQTAIRLLPNLQANLPPRASLSVLFLIAPLALGLMLLCVAGAIRILQQFFSGEPAEFSLVFKVVSYAASPFILSVVPFVGPAVGAVWFLITLFAGCRHGLGLPWKLAVAVPLLPALLLIYGVFWYFL